MWASDPKSAPFDAHMVVSLIAPRPLLRQTGNTDKWSDPYGEFLTAKAATPVYTIHNGGHAVLPEDWKVYLDFLDKHLKPRK